MNSHPRAVALMVLVTMLWAIAGVVTRQLEAARSFEVTFWRSLFTLLSLAPMLLLLRGPALLRSLRDGGAALWLSGLCWAVMFTAFMLALTLTTVANVLITMALAPLIAALIARASLGHRVAPRTWWAIGVAGAGIALMYGAKFAAGEVAGTLVALAVPVGSAVNWTVNQQAQRQGERVDLVPAVLLGALISCAVTLPLALPLQATSHDLRLLALLGVVQLAIPSTLAVVCARVLAAPEMALLGLLEVVFGIALAWLGAGERPAPAVLMGGVLVLGALAVNEFIAWRQPA